MTAVDEIKARVDIVDLVSQTVELRRSGRNHIGFCPFHSNTRTPAFVVWPETGTWRCFGECNEGGDIFRFVMKKEGWDFPEALRYLADLAGVILEPPTPERQEKLEEDERLRKLLEEAVIFFKHNLLQTTEGKAGHSYLAERGLSNETIDAFEIGYAPDSWDATSTYLTPKGYSEQDLIDSGLASARDSGGVYDRFRGRVIIPIRDERGRMVGFGARTLDPEGLPKYLNSPQTSIFDKGRILFGLNHARREISAQDQVVIVEGYMGVFAPHQHGYTNVVATMGTALTEDHIRLIKRYSSRIILAMDSDTAGVNATLRGLEVARQTLDRDSEIIFDARGLLRWEGRLQADIRVSTLPVGMDPDDVVNQNPQDWEKLISEAKPIVEHLMETMAQGQDLGDPKIKTEIAAQVVPLIADLPSAIERDTYQQMLARLLRVDERTLLGFGQFHSRRQRYRTRKDSKEKSAIISPRNTLGLNQNRETYILGVIIRQPEIIYRIDRFLQEDGLMRINKADFENKDHQEIVQLLIFSLDQNEIEPLDYVLNHLPDPLMEIADAILEKTEDLDLNRDDILEDILRALIMVREHKISQELELLRYLQETAQEEGDLKASEYQETMLNYSTIRGRLHKARDRYSHHLFPDLKG